jgi:hypothetical protein
MLEVKNALLQKKKHVKSVIVGEKFENEIVLDASNFSKEAMAIIAITSFENSQAVLTGDGAITFFQVDKIQNVVKEDGQLYWPHENLHPAIFKIVDSSSLVVCDKKTCRYRS